MQAELEKQRQDMEALQAHPELTPTFVAEFRRSAALGGIRPFRRGFVKSKG